MGVKPVWKQSCLQLYLVPLVGRPSSSIAVIAKVSLRCFLNTFVCSLSIWEDFWDSQWGSKPVHGLKLEASCSRLMWISSLQYASCLEVYTVYFSQRDPHSYPNLCVCGRVGAKGAQAPHIRARLSFPWLLTGTETSETHVSDQVKPASLVCKHAAPGKPTESTFIFSNPVT